MNYLHNEAILGDNECPEDAEKSARALELELKEIEQKISDLPADADSVEQLKLELSKCYVMLDLDHQSEAHPLALLLLKQAISGEHWLQAVEACDILFQSDQDDAVKALAHGIWLSVTFPIDPEMSVAMLQHLVDESVDRSDGAAVAAATAGYIVNLRAEGKQREELQFFTMQLLGEVARRHSQVDEQEVFDFWVQQLELDDPAKFLPRLAAVLDILTDNDWWYDRDSLRAKIPQEA